MVPISLKKREKSVKCHHRRRLEKFLKIVSRIKSDKYQLTIIKKNKSIFENLMDFATREYYLNYDAEIIADLILFLGQQSQNNLILRLINKKIPTPDEQNNEDFVDENFWFSFFGYSRQSRKYIPDVSDFRIIDRSKSYEVDIHKVIYFTQPWSKSKLADRLTAIGKERKDGEWDSSAQMRGGNTPSLFLPSRIMQYASGGTHSTATNIIRRLGMVKTNRVIFLDKILEMVDCDGVHYKLKENNVLIESVYNPYGAAIFELSKILLHAGMTYENKDDWVKNFVCSEYLL
jgi:hypothetical protein